MSALEHCAGPKASPPAGAARGPRTRSLPPSARAVGLSLRRGPRAAGVVDGRLPPCSVSTTRAARARSSTRPNARSPRLPASRARTCRPACRPHATSTPPPRPDRRSSCRRSARGPAAPALPNAPPRAIARSRTRQRCSCRRPASQRAPHRRARCRRAADRRSSAPARPPVDRPKRPSTVPRRAPPASRASSRSACVATDHAATPRPRPARRPCPRAGRARCRDPPSRASPTARIERRSPLCGRPAVSTASLSPRAWPHATRQHDACGRDRSVQPANRRARRCAPTMSAALAVSATSRGLMIASRRRPRTHPRAQTEARPWRLA